MYVAQAITKIDAARAEKHPFRVETRVVYLFGLRPYPDGQPLVSNPVRLDFRADATMLDTKEGLRQQP